ncbi:penicillin-binding protein 1A [Methyloglobulus sp.]|uniref:penicillin-binding protein 1A n=1 Tax=Methyloglobulus sp. TaxID=2518622 RepID=UPI0032B7FD8C
MSIKLQNGNILKWLAIFIAVIIVGIAASGYVIYGHLAAELPDVKTLRDVRYEVPLSIFSKDNQLIAQFGGNKRMPIKIEAVPKQLINAFLAAEDDSFFDHPGVDYKGLIRAGLQLAMTGKKKQGGSTITMQVTRNFLLTSEKTYTRKLKEIILALKIEREYSKDKILELYLNQIYMGHSAYGIVAAAQTYYGKSLDELTLAEQAMIAGLPKAPSAYNPVTNQERALERRNYVLQRMLELNHISQEDYETASQQDSTAKLQYHSSDLAVPFVAEMVRQFIHEKYGEEAYTLGLNVYTTIDPVLQKAADKALRNTLHTYDERHGFRIPRQEGVSGNQAAKISPVAGDTLAATVTSLDNQHVKAELYTGAAIEIPWNKIKWGGNKATKYLKPGVPIRVRQVKNGIWALTQIPEVEGAFVSLNPNNGAVLALVGGFEFNENKFNRAIQAKRQPGSGFKPIIYTSALEEGYTAASMVNDAPISVFDPSLGRNWKPENSTKKFYGPTSLRKGLTYSRNMVAIQLLKDIGIAKGVATGIRFGFTKEQLPPGLSLALGSGYASPLEMSRMYAVFANGGFLVDPYFIERIVSHEGKVIFQAKPKTACPTCTNTEEAEQNHAPRIISPGINFIMNSMMRDVVKMGTATDARALGRSDIAGKTGTTNDQRDAWFNGFTPTHVASAWVGFDNFKPLGHYETGGVAALPMWIEYMRTALKNTPVAAFNPPNDVFKKGSEYIQKGVVLKKIAAIPSTKKKKEPGAEAKRLIKEKPVEALF